LKHKPTPRGLTPKENRPKRTDIAKLKEISNQQHFLSVSDNASNEFSNFTEDNVEDTVSKLNNNLAQYLQQIRIGKTGVTRWNQKKRLKIIHISLKSQKHIICITCM